MPLFHFMTRDGPHGSELDTCDLPNVAAARQMAVVFVGDILRDLRGGVYDEGLHVVVTDDAGNLCWDLRIDAVEGPGALRD
jgi:hypothetical protein